MSTPQLLFFCLISLLFFAACENDMEEIQRIIEQEELSVEQAKDVSIFYSDSAVVRIKISGPTMLNYLDRKNPRKEFPDGVHVEFFDEQKRPQTQLTAKYAVRDEKKNKIIIRDSVIVKTAKQETLETQELIWDEQKEIVYSDKFVSIRTAKELIYGTGLEANQDFTKWTIKKVSGEIEIDEQPK